MTKTVHLKIRGQEFVLKSEHDPAHLKKVAEFVDKKIEDIYSRTQIADSHKLFLLTAINIADDLFQLKSDLDRLQGEVDGRMQALIKLIDNES